MHDDDSSWAVLTCGYYNGGGASDGYGYGDDRKRSSGDAGQYGSGDGGGIGAGYSSRTGPSDGGGMAYGGNDHVDGFGCGYGCGNGPVHDSPVYDGYGCGYDDGFGHGFSVGCGDGRNVIDYGKKYYRSLGDVDDKMDITSR